MRAGSPASSACMMRLDAFHRRAHSLKSGKVVVVLSGRHAGKKAVIVKAYDDGKDSRKYGHCLGACALAWGVGSRPAALTARAAVAGVDRHPRKVTKSMTDKLLKKRSKVKPFLKFVNFNHIMPTRYSTDLDLKRIVDETLMSNPEKRGEMRKEVKKIFEQRYLNQSEAKSEKNKQGTSYLFKKLRF